ncbi:MAG: glycine--tRNA ligase [Candidatus Norongarragalinales archaeon]
MPADSLEKIINLCLRRAILFPSAEPYAALTAAFGGFAGFFDYGHYGALLKRRVESEWFDRFVRQREDVVVLEGAIVTPRAVLEASGHLASFNDPLVECVKCRSKYRADHLIEKELKRSVDGISLERLAEMLVAEKIVCPKCSGALGEVKTFNLMFPTTVGAAPDCASGEASKAANATAFLRPETAQSIFVDFPRLALACRKQLPFGIAQSGRVFRNEIAPRNFVFRSREFSLFEIEFFVHPWKLEECEIPDRLASIEIAFLDVKTQHAAREKTMAQPSKATFGKLAYEKIISNKWVAYWLAEFVDWFASLGIPTTRLRLRQHLSDELSHYSRETWDVEYDYPGLGWKELMGVADRGDYDLKAHSKKSGKEFAVFDEAAKQKIIPFVVEPSLGTDRLVFTLLCEAFKEKIEKGETKTILSLNPRIAPVQACVFPLMKKDGLAEKARGVFDSLKKEGFAVEYDESGSIGKRYARADEIGTPFCITIDYDSLEKNDCTIRERDSAAQERVKLKDLPRKLRAKLEGGE